MAFADYLAQTFPGVRITSGKRDPNGRLGRANPRSFHNRGMAWDVAPIEGMSYDDFVGRVRNDGWNVLEARDEVTNPSRHATGPHWHMATDGRKEPRMGLADIMAQVRPLAQQEAQQPTGLAGILQGAPQSIAPGEMSIQIPSLPDMSKKPGAFSKGGKGWQIMGIIGDALQTAGGGRGTYAPFVADQQEREDLARQRLQEMMARRQERQEDRANSLEDWQIKQQWERDNPAPTQMTETERLIEQWHSLPDSDPRKAMIARALRGSAYDPSVYQPKEDYQVAGRLKVKTTAPGKAPPASQAAKLPSGFILD
jgi:hypothetical protein